MGVWFSNDLREVIADTEAVVIHLKVFFDDIKVAYFRMAALIEVSGNFASYCSVHLITGEHVLVQYLRIP